MRSAIFRDLVFLWALFSLLSLVHTQIILAAEPQKEIEIHTQSAHDFDVFVPIDQSSDAAADTFILPLPAYLRDGFLPTEDTASCTTTNDLGGIMCTGLPFSSTMHFRWDTHAIFENKYCVESIGEKLASNPWAASYLFSSTISPSWVRRLTIENLDVGGGSVAGTYADFASQSGYAILWSFGGAPAGVQSRIFSSADGNTPLLGSLRSMSANEASLFVFDREKNAVNIESARLLACSTPDIEIASFDQPIEVEYFENNGTEKVDTVSYAPLRFGYDSLVSSFSPTDTPIVTPTSTLTPTPTTHVVVIASSTATPTPQSSISSTPTFTPTPQKTQEGDVLGSNNSQTHRIPQSTSGGAYSATSVPQESGGEVLGAEANTALKDVGQHPVQIPWWIGGLALSFVLVSIILIWLRRSKLKHLIGIFAILCIGQAMTHCVYATSPQMLAHITGPRTYYAGCSGSIDLIITPSYFYFEGVQPGGKMVLSSTPDGTGNVSLGNGGFLTRTLVNWSSTQNFGMNPPTHLGNCFAAQNLPPVELPNQYFTSPNTTYSVRATFQGYCPSATPWQVSDVYLVYFPPEPTATPTQTPTPTPTTVPPFLDLPWDYENDKLSFSDAALNMTSYFDHEYPTLSIGGMFDPDKFVVGTDGVKDKREYTSHDGYDYAKFSKVSYGDDQLAAAAGIASYHYDKFSGNAIFIDHGNGYQTRYYHMQPDDLIVNAVGQTKPVSARQKIGKVGFTGNVDPAGISGAHIHFMVIYDKNHDGNFQDNIPDGLVDPFGWQGAGADPWEIFQFSYAGHMRTGMRSRYLWKYPLAQASQSVGPEGGELQNGKVKITVPSFTIPNLLEFFIKSAPRTETEGGLESVGSIAEITAIDGGGVGVKRFAQPINVSFTYSDEDVLYYAPDSMSVYSSPDGALWQKEQTLIDHDSHTATASVNHLTFFALMGEKRDTIAPQTTAQLEGQGNASDFQSNVIVTLIPEDNAEGLGIDYTLYKLDDSEWGAYSGPLNVSTEGIHTLEYFSADKSGNVENVQTVEFKIDKTAPEIQVFYDLTTQDFVFSTDGDATMSAALTNDSSDTVISAQDVAGNMNELTYHVVADGNLTTLAILGDNPGLYAISNETHGERGSAEDLQGRYEYFSAGEMMVRKIPTADGRLSINANVDIIADTATTSLHIITNHGTLEIHEEN